MRSDPLRKHRNLIILLVMAALVAASLYFIIPPGVKTHLGLDLQGGHHQQDDEVSVLSQRITAPAALGGRQALERVSDREGPRNLRTRPRAEPVQ